MDERCQSIRQALAGAEEVLASLQSDPSTDLRLLRAAISEVRRLRNELAKCLSGPVLTGVWASDDGGLYYIRQLGNEIWWLGLSTESRLGHNDFHVGLTFSNVFQGNLEGDIIRGDWADVPRGVILQSGTLTLRLGSQDSPTSFVRLDETGGFGGFSWNKTSEPSVPNIRSRFDNVFRNDGGTMHDHLKMYMDNVVVVGKVVGPFGASLPKDVSRRYENFMCNADGDFDSGDFDGDLVMFMVIERELLEAQLNAPGLNANGPFNNVDDIRQKLNSDNSEGEAPEFRGLTNLVHAEVIMYGRPAGIFNCTGDVPPLLPGWMEPRANSVLFNGRPLDGNVNQGNNPGEVISPQVRVNERVRATGFFALDCHGGDCEEDERANNNVEIHPVYAFDTFRPDFERQDLTGAWHASDAGTYYIRQLGDQVWWAGMSRDRGRTFTNVFRGRFQRAPRGFQISGRFVDVPLGTISNTGELVLQGPNFFTLTFAGGSNVFGARRWEKMREGGVIGPPVS
jgi:hypothetical protein